MKSQETCVRYPVGCNIEYWAGSKIGWIQCTVQKCKPSSQQYFVITAEEIFWVHEDRLGVHQKNWAAFKAQVPHPPQSRTRKNRYRKLLESLGSKEPRSSAPGYTQSAEQPKKPSKVAYDHMTDILSLEARQQRARRDQKRREYRDSKMVAAFVRMTVATASRDQVISALHKSLKSKND